MGGLDHNLRRGRGENEEDSIGLANLSGVKLAWKSFVASGRGTVMKVSSIQLSNAVHRHTPFLA